MIFEKIKNSLQKAESVKCYGSRNSGNYMIPLADAIDIINQVEAEYNDGWIKCEDELPKETQKYYLTYYKRDGGLLGTQNLAFVSKDYFMSDKRWEVEDEYPDAKVYYWQPLPQPPKGE